MRIALPFATVVCALLAQALPDAGANSPAVIAPVDAGAWSGVPAANASAPGQLVDGGSPPSPTAQLGFPADAGAPEAPLPLAPPRPLPPIPAGLGRVAGRISLAGPIPASKPAMVVGQAPITGGPPVAAAFQPLGGAAPSARDIRVCGVTQPDLSLQIGLGGGVLETVLWASDGPPPAKGTKAHARISIDGCRFMPHVAVTTVGADLTLVNSDALYHNVTGSNLEQFSYALVLKDHELPMKVKKAGLLVLESKNHPWMKGYLQVLPTSAWCMTDTDGSYFLDLPPGKHSIKLWHERLGEREESVDIAAGETTLKDFALAPR